MTSPPDEGERTQETAATTERSPALRFGDWSRGRASDPALIDGVRSTQEELVRLVENIDDAIATTRPEEGIVVAA